MVPPDPLPRQFAGEQAHLEREQQTSFPRHGHLNLKLESLRRRTCVASRHAQMLPRYNNRAVGGSLRPLRSLRQKIRLTLFRRRRQFTELWRTSQLCPYGIVLQTRVGTIVPGDRTFKHLHGCIFLPAVKKVGRNHVTGFGVAIGDSLGNSFTED